MKFCVIRLGSSSVNEIIKINSAQGIRPIEKPVEIVCRQVPNNIDDSTFCFIWLGSDNNKGTPTVWKQGLRAIGKIQNKEGGPTYSDEWKLTIEIGIVFRRSINKQEILRNSGLQYINISEVPVIGLNTFSNQTVQFIKPNEHAQIDVLFNTLIAFQSELYNDINNVYPELNIFISNKEESQYTEPIKESAEKQIEETNEENVPIKIPFDPNLIRIRRDPYTLGELIDRIEHDEINFFTGFQRKAELWDDVKQSRLIESILLKLPLPAFFFDENEGNKWQVIDGLQRTSAIRNFIVLNKLVLQKLEFLTQFNDKKFEDLPRDLNRRIKTTPLTVYVVEKGTPDEVKFNIFKRINTGGLILTAQEIRHALNQGIPSTFIADLAVQEEFKEATCYKINSDRMEDRDFVTRFISFYIIPYFQYEPDLDSFMTKGMAGLKNTTLEQRNHIKEAFIKAMRTAIAIFGNDAFRKRQHVNDRRKPLNKALFEALSVSFSQLSDEKRRILIYRNDLFRTKFIELNNNDKFLSAISSGTGQWESVIVRFSELNRIVMETINSETND